MRSSRRHGRPHDAFAAVTALMLLLFCAACDGPATGNAAAKLAGPPTPLGTATVTGTVRFRGTPPPAEQVPASHCDTNGEPIEVRLVDADDQGRLRDVVVYLKDAVGGAPGSPPAGEPVLLDQVRCVYVPHTVALRVGQTLRVKSSDPTLHNVHGLPARNESFNFGMTAAGQTKDMTFAVPEAFTVKCDVHPWMSASVNVFDHVFFAVTGPDGRYEIKNLPPGRHTLVFRHDFLGEVEVEVEAADGKTATADAVFAKDG